MPDQTVCIEWYRVAPNPHAPGLVIITSVLSDFASEGIIWKGPDHVGAWVELVALADRT